MSRDEFKKISRNNTLEVFMGRKNQKFLHHKNSYKTKIGPVPVPEDFFISTTISGSWLTYKTDTYRRIDIQPYVDTVIQNTNEIVRNGDDFYVITNFIDDEVTPSTIIKIGECKIFNNQFIFETIEELVLPIGRFHGATYYRDFIYLLTRPLGASGYTTCVRVDTELEDVKVLSLTGNTQFMGRPTDIICYSGDAYTIIARGQAIPGYFVKINGDLSEANVVFSAGSTTAKRIRAQSPFLIYNDEVYIPTYNTAAQPAAGNTIGLAVYDFNGNVIREVVGIPISVGETIQPFPHWMGIFGGKVIISCASNGSPHKFLIRFDCITLAKEEQLDLDMLVTDDNTIFSDGYMYINGEYSTDLLTPQLLKVKYDDFSDVTVEIADYNNGLGSYGSINPILNV